MASAPWEMAQFSLKGLDELLEAACKLPYLKLILMWRGLFLDELTERVARHGLHARVEIVNHKADMNSHLARAHGTVLLAKRSDVVKAYPHSLVESLIAGKPVLVSDKIPIGDDVRRRGCGIVLPEVSVPVLVDAIEALRQNYKSLVRNTVVIRPDAFSLSSLIENHRQLYGTVG
jgi:glycosyltransferase involved in cell wall biosynthesis